ncbi:MAG: hypothetical protein JW913_02995 [Chitinispirillaceae bacterium]|nr:hypothetical protein [Chitinispirillaceae bacterium]
MGRRYYDPEIGSWTSTDPAGQYFSSYLYCSNNPILVVDPDGNFSWVPAIVGAAMGAIQGGIIADQNGGNVGLGMLGGAAIGFGSGALGSWVGDFSNNAMLSAMMSSAAASTANSIGMYALSGGKTDISTSYGPFSMNWSKGKFNVASPTNPMGMLAWFSFMQDINAAIPYGPQAQGKGPGEGIELNNRKLDYAGGGATDPKVSIRYAEDIPAARGHDPGYVAQGVTIRDNVGTVRALGFDRRVIGADFALARSELAIRNSVLGYLDPITRSNAGLIAAFGVATGTVKSLGYASWFQW